MCTNLNTGKGDLFSILGDDESPGRVLVIQYASEFDNLQILVANVLDSGNNHQVVHGRDFACGSRERNLKTGGGGDHGLGVSTDGCETKSDER